MKKSLADKVFEDAVREYPTPIYVYDEEGIRKTARKVNDAFSWNKGYKNYYAVKALPNPRILEILLSEGMGLDCSSYTELLTAEKLGLTGNDLIFSSNDTPARDFKKAMQLGAIINLDDSTHLDFLDEVAGLPGLLCFRYNPGSLIKGTDIIGRPVDAKFGMTSQQIIDTIGLAQQKGVKRFGLHTMAISNNLDIQVALDITKALFDLAKAIHYSTRVELEFIDLGGGVGIPYKPQDEEFPIEDYARKVKQQLMSILDYEPSIYTEFGRYITGPHGYLVSKVIHIKRTYKTYIGLDASMQNLMRPGMYGAYHLITVLGKKEDNPSETYDVTGSLCENNDKFAINRKLPKMTIGDIVIIHDAGSHAHSMGFNYNGLLRSAELLRQTNGSFKLIRRAETPDDHFATLI